MKRLADTTVRGFGISVMFAILLSQTGCSTPAPSNTPMAYSDLNTFVIDCKRRDEQLRFLSSMLNDAEERQGAMWANALQPWRQFTDPEGQQRHAAMSSGRMNYDIKQLIYLIHVNCGGVYR